MGVVMELVNQLLVILIAPTVGTPRLTATQKDRMSCSS